MWGGGATNTVNLLCCTYRWRFQNYGYDSSQHKDNTDCNWWRTIRNTRGIFFWFIQGFFDPIPPPPKGFVSRRRAAGAGTAHLVEERALRMVDSRYRKRHWPARRPEQRGVGLAEDTAPVGNWLEATLNQDAVVSASRQRPACRVYTHEDNHHEGKNCGWTYKLLLNSTAVYLWRDDLPPRTLDIPRICWVPAKRHWIHLPIEITKTTSPNTGESDRLNTFSHLDKIVAIAQQYNCSTRIYAKVSLPYYLPMHNLIDVWSTVFDVVFKRILSSIEASWCVYCVSHSTECTLYVRWCTGMHTWVHKLNVVQL